MQNMNIKVGRFALQPFRQLRLDGRPVALGNKALEILSTLATANGEIVTKSELINLVWAGLSIEENALQVHVVALRKALGDDAKLLVTVRGLGYRLEVGYINDNHQTGFKQFGSLAVLAFVNMTGDPQLDYLGEGMAEELINALSRIPGLKVSSRTSSFAFKNRNIDVRQISDQLNVAAIIEGSVRIAGGRARVTAQLIDAEDGNHIWSKNLDHEFADLLILQGDITDAIMHSLQRYIQSEPQNMPALLAI